ncbi:MAG: beta-N-acetylhexosaminidase [Gemmatimonadota bacterium]|nr:beta-N-acetylhexosaminidase [Gemmatimonadota bacterium]
MKRLPVFTVALFTILLISASAEAQETTPLWSNGINLIPTPREVRLGGDGFVFGPRTAMVLDAGASEADRFTAGDLASRLEADWGIKAQTGGPATGSAVVLTREKAPAELGPQGYALAVEKDRVTIRAAGEAGLFYGARTLLQIIRQGRDGPFVKGMEITDRPDIPQRAVHYDTKHFQERREYVENFIRTLADYKINMLIWEWEDKFAYRKHPEIGAPGAFTMEEMQALTRYARKYHVQLVPLVQGLGHASFILKWPQHASLRELASSNWQFCPHKEGTYKLMFDLLDEAIEATPGSEYIHLGCDETYELGRGTECECKALMEKKGKYALKQLYLHRVAEHVKARGRKVMAWDWPDAFKPEDEIKPPSGTVLFAGIQNLEANKGASADGYPVWIYDPNPGIEHLFLGYHYRIRRGEKRQSCTEHSYKTLTTAALSGLYDGSVSTSWNCSGVHNQIWMLRYITGAEYSWSGQGPALEEFKEKYFKNYYGPAAQDLQELFTLMNKGAYYYMETFGRKVWHWANVEKVLLPDLPRGDAIEYDPFWNRQYAGTLERSRDQLGKMQRALIICRNNQGLDLKNSYDFDLIASIAELYAHTARTYIALSELENAITRAHRAHFTSHHQAYQAMENAARIIQQSLAGRERMFKAFVSTWEKTQLPRGMSTPEKKYFHATDRGRNFFNRRPDLSTAIYDEQRLDLEGYLGSLRKYMAWYRKAYM